MTGTTQSSSELDRRRARIHFRAWHRGTKEMDLIFGTFVDKKLKDLNEKELTELEFIMSHEDTDLAKWVLGEKPVPANIDTPFFRSILDFKPDF